MNDLTGLQNTLIFILLPHRSYCPECYNVSQLQQMHLSQHIASHLSPCSFSYATSQLSQEGPSTLENTDIPMQPSIVFWFVPEATVIRAVLLADGNFVCILKTEAQEKVVYSSACSEKAASLPLLFPEATCIFYGLLWLLSSLFYRHADIQSSLGSSSF